MYDFNESSALMHRLMRENAEYPKNKYKFSGEGVYIGRGSLWGNPFVIGKDGNRDEVVSKFYYHFKNNFVEKYALHIEELRSKNLICFCNPNLCHGHILAEFANMNRGEREHDIWEYNKEKWIGEDVDDIPEWVTI